MKVIAGKRLRELLSTNNGAAKLTIQLLLDNCLEEIDTLTVSTLRSMSDAPKDCSWILVYCQPIGYATGMFFSYMFNERMGVFVDEDDRALMVDVAKGWIPMPTYKPELTGDGGKNALIVG